MKELAATFERIGATVGPFGLVPDDMRQRRFNDFAGVRCFVGSPVFEGRPETMRGNARNPHPAQQRRKHHVGVCAPRLTRPNQIVRLPVVRLFADQLDGAGGEGDAVFPTAFHLIGGDRPQSIFHVAPSHVADFTGARRREDGKLKHSRRRRRPRLQLHDEGRYILVRHGRMMAPHKLLRGGQDHLDMAAPPGRVFARAMPRSLGGIQDTFDAATDAGGCFGEPVPYRPDARKHVFRSDAVNRKLGYRLGVIIKRLLPLPAMGGIAPRLGTVADKRLGRVGKNRDSGRGCANRKRVCAVGDAEASGGSLFPRNGQGDGVNATKAHLPPLAVEAIKEDPSPRPGRVHHKIQPAAVSMSARLPLSLYPPCGKDVDRPRHSYPTGYPTNSLSPSDRMWRAMASGEGRGWAFFLPYDANFVASWHRMALTDGGESGIQTGLEIIGDFALSDVYPTIRPNNDEDAAFRSVVQIVRIFARHCDNRPMRVERFGWAAAAWASAMRRDGSISFAIHRMREVDWPSHIWIGGIRTHNYETKEHSTLKLAAADWMRRQGMADAKNEARFDGWRFDAFSEAGKMVVEVGHTPVSKLYMCAIEGFRFLLIPYRADNERHIQRSFAIEFVMSDAAREAARRGDFL